jgi:hypothetical protein
MGKFAVAAMAPVLFVLGVTPFSNASEVLSRPTRLGTLDKRELFGQ